MYTAVVLQYTRRPEAIVALSRAQPQVGKIGNRMQPVTMRRSTKAHNSPSPMSDVMHSAACRSLIPGEPGTARPLLLAEHIQKLHGHTDHNDVSGKRVALKQTLVLELSSRRQYCALRHVGFGCDDSQEVAYSQGEVAACLGHGTGEGLG